MGWQVIVALALVIPFILIPVLFVWYLNMGGLYTAFKERLATRKQARRVKRPAAEVAVPVNEQSGEK